MSRNPRFLFLGLFLAFHLLVHAPSHAARTVLPLEDRQSRSALFDWSPLVQQIQQFLIEFDLLAGPANGRMTPETQQAIRAYQEQSDRPVTGGADEDLLRHMETVGRAATLKKRLARARDQQVEKARNALEGSAATRDLLQSDKPLLAAVPQDGIDRCLRAPDIACLLESAIGAVSKIAREDYRDWALRDIVRALAAAGKLEEARQTIRQLSDLRLVLVSLRETAAALAEAGNAAEALALTETIPDPWNRSRALLAVAIAETENDAVVDTLIELLPKLEDRAGAIEIAAELLSELAEKGHASSADAVFDMTQTLLDGVKDEARIALGTLATGYAKAGRQKSASAVMKRLGESGRDTIAFAEYAAMLARQGDMSAAMAAANRLRTPRLFVLAMTKVAAALHEQDRTNAAADALRKAEAATPDIERAFAADTAWAQIATVWSDLALPNQALERIGKIKSRTLSAQTLWGFAAKSQEPDSGMFDRAVAATDLIESTFDRAATFARAATGLAKAGRLDQARQAFDYAVREAKAIRNGWWQARILSLLSTVLTKF